MRTLWARKIETKRTKKKEGRLIRIMSTMKLRPTMATGPSSEAGKFDAITYFVEENRDSHERHT